MSSDRLSSSTSSTTATPLRDADEVFAAYQDCEGIPLVLRVDPTRGYLYPIEEEEIDDPSGPAITLLSDCAYLVLSPAQPKIVFFWIGNKAPLTTVAAISIKALEIRGADTSGSDTRGGHSCTQREDQGQESDEFHHALYGYYRWSSRSPTGGASTRAVKRRRPAETSLLRHESPCLYCVLARGSRASAGRSQRVSFVMLARPLVAEEVLGQSQRVMLLTDFGNRCIYLWCGKSAGLQLRGSGLEAASYLTQVRGVDSYHHY